MSSQGRRNDVVFGVAIKLKQQCFLFFKHVTYFEWDVGIFGQVIAIPPVPLPTALLLFYTESEN